MYTHAPTLSRGTWRIAVLISDGKKSLRDIMSDTVCMTNPLSTSSGCSSPLGSPSGVKCLSSSLASSSVELPLWLSLGPIRLSEELLLNSLHLWMTLKFIHATNHKLTIPTIEQMHKLFSHLIHCFEIHKQRQQLKAPDMLMSFQIRWYGNRWFTWIFVGLSVCSHSFVGRSFLAILCEHNVSHLWKNCNG